MANRLRPLAILEGDQRRAAHPRDHAALSASAGTGKTHVLTARVLRLLLAGVDPASILCLTFTKAGAAEMAERIHARLAYWVRVKAITLAAELNALGEDVSPPMQERARTLFARVLEAPGGGLRIQTIHAFAQSLLAAFPSEAGLIQGFKPLEGREEQLLSRSTLAELLVRAEEQGDFGLIRDLQALSLRLGEAGAERFLMACARAPEAMAALGPREGVEARLRLMFELPVGNIDDALARECEAFDVDSLRRIGALNGQWGTKSGLDRASLCERWIAAEPSERVSLLESLHAVWAKADGDPRSAAKGQAPQNAEYAELISAAFECCARLLTMQKLAGFIAILAAGLRAGQAFAIAYERAKRATGALDFDDLIRKAEELLASDGIGDWVRFKLDQRTDHILIDEAQDTNARQWRIVNALVSEFFAGEGAQGAYRTIFTVGDFKQAIFGFQGTDPREFERTRDYFRAKALTVRDAAEAADLPRDKWPPDFLDLSMDKSFRSSPPVLEVVDRVMDDIGHEALGLPGRANPHSSNHPARPGSVTLWFPLANEAGDEAEAGEEGWISDAVRRHAGQVARQVRTWLANPFDVQDGRKRRPLRPEDIMILVRRRGELAALLVARLHAEGVPVAGVDRLLLSAPLAVQDLLAAARFAAQPLDDLNLASLLVSPLFGWSQDELFEAAFKRDGRLWPHLRARAPAGLSDILAMADYATPHAFFETILSGPIDGRRKLLGRLGAEARDPIEELLSSALEFESNNAASLQAFLDWFARGEVEIVRDPSRPMDAVRVMTVHGAKGLQAPVVILADACADPDRAGPGSWMAALDLDGAKVPVFRPKKDELAEPLRAQVELQDRLDREEHWRLLYVAMTRAEERLYLGGALSVRDRNGPPEASWYRAVENAVTGLGSDWSESPLWPREMRVGAAENAVTASVKAVQGLPAPPSWLRRPAPAEERPPRPLVPSSLGEEDYADPPPSAVLRAAAERGRLLHALFERLPGVAPGQRRALADPWLQYSAGVAEALSRTELIDAACRIVDDPRFADLFGPAALAEAPVAAVVEGGAVVAGTVDRLLVTTDRILIADFKTGRKAPRTEAEIPAAHLRQMAAYRAALRVVFPDRPVEAALLYTAAPVLYLLPAALLDAHAP